MHSTADNLELPQNYPIDWVKDVTLDDGTPVTIRPIRPDDAPRLQIGFKRLTPESIYLRFLETIDELTNEQASYYANVDYWKRMAFVATTIDGGKEYVVAVARYDMVGGQRPGMAESAVIVGDEYQGRGLGTALMITLIEYARQHGVSHFIGTIHHSNTRILEIIKESGYPYEREMIEPGVWEVRVEINKDF